MQTQQEFGFKQLLTHMITDMAKAICERNGETQQQQFVRSQAAVHMILAFVPRDAIEAMLAGHCVMFHEVLTDGVRETLRGEMDTMRQGTRNNLVALNKAFVMNLDRLEKYQRRPTQGTRDVPLAETAKTETPAPEMTESKEPVSQAAECPSPNADAIAACKANEEAMAALDANDPVRFAKAMGVQDPSPAYVAAASSQMADLNARRDPPLARPVRNGRR